MSHVSGLFTRRGYNIDSIAVGVTDDPERSSMTIVLRGDENSLEQFHGQLLKLPDVLEVRVLPYHASVVRELLLVRVKALPEKRPEIFAIAEVFDGKVADINEENMLIEVNGNSRRISGIIQMLSRFGILEIARTGQIALALDSNAD